MGFHDLPLDLKNVVCDIAYGCKWESVKESLEVCESIKKMDLAPVLLRETMWSNVYVSQRPSILTEFEPIENFSKCWAEVIDWSVVQELLFRLDFRRKFVRLVFSRCEWRALFKQDWRNIQVFDGFFRFLMYTRVNCFKPLWQRIGFRQLKNEYRSSLISLWWATNDF